jgi:hypothetical protein
MRLKTIHTRLPKGHERADVHRCARPVELVAELPGHRGSLGHLLIHIAGALRIGYQERLRDRRRAVVNVPIRNLLEPLDELLCLLLLVPAIQPSQVYQWQKVLFENAAAVFERPNRRTEDAKDRKVSHLETKLQQKNEVIAELMQEHVQSKKAIGEP